MDRPLPSPSDPNAGLRRFLPLLIAGLTVAAFLPALGGEFLNWDDDANFLGNLHYRGLGPNNLRWMFTDTFGHYMPLTWLTLGLDYVLWGMNPFGYHLTNLLLHALDAVLLYWILVRLLKAARPEASEAAVDAASAAGALFFSLHPLRVESVAWITERRDNLSCAFFLGTFLLYLRYAALPEGAPGRWKPLAGSALCFAAMLLSKTLGLTLPFLLLILDVYPLRRFTRETAAARLREKLPHFALMIGGLLMLSFTAAKAEGVTPREQYSYVQSLLQPGFRVCFYVAKTLLPVELSPLYWYRPGIGLRQILGTAALLGSTLLLFVARRRFPSGLAAWVSYGLLIAPASGLVQFGSVYAADRYTYIPCLPFAALFAGAVLVLSTRLRPVPLGAGVAVLLLVFAFLTSRQCLIWRDSVALWTRAIELDPDVYFTHAYRARAYAAKGAWPQAMQDFDRSLALNPGWYEAWGFRARARLSSGDPQGAAADATAALRLEPGWSEGHGVRGLALSQLGKHAEAEADFSKALEKRPNFVEARVGRATERALRGDFDGAKADFDQALAFDPHPAVYLRRATVRGMTGDLDGAIADLDEAIRRKPDYGDAYARRGMALLERNRKPEAARDLERALELLPPQGASRAPLEAALQRARTP